MIITALIIALTVTASMEIGRNSAEKSNKEKIEKESEEKYRDEILNQEKK